MSALEFTRREWLFAAQAAATAPRATAPHATTEPHFWSLTAAAAQIRRKRISSEELTHLMLARIAKRNERLNAYITVLADAAMEQARALDREPPRGPLHGVPIALKDNIDTAGVRTTGAAEVIKDRVPQEDAEVARRVKDAGAVLLGKLNLDEWAFEGTGTTGYFGVVRNPWELTRITGGSSAGSSASRSSLYSVS